MKPVLALIFGCVPLAALTARSFVELASGQSRPALPAISPSWDDEAAAAAKARAQIKADEPLLRGLSEADLFDANPTAALQNVPSGSGLKSVGDTWPQWLRARRLVAKVLEAEQWAATNDPQQLQQASRQMEELQAKCRALSPREAEQLLQLLDRRQAALTAKIARRGREAEAAQALSAARAAFQAEQYDRCVKLCDQLLSKHVDALDVDAIDKLRLLRRRAQFWGDVQGLSQPAQSTRAPAGRIAALRSFLDKYAQREGRTDAEMQVLKQFEAEFHHLRQQTTATEHGR